VRTNYERLFLRDFGPAHGTASCGGDLASESFVREEIGTIRQHIDYEAGVADRHRIQEPGSRLGDERERHDAFGVRAEP